MVECTFLYARERPNKIWCSIPFHFFFLRLAIQQHFESHGGKIYPSLKPQRYSKIQE